MKNTRIITQGLLIGGGIGAKLGSYVHIFNQSDPFAWIPVGLIIGSILGISVAFWLLNRRLDGYLIPRMTTKRIKRVESIKALFAQS